MNSSRVNDSWLSDLGTSCSRRSATMRPMSSSVPLLPITSLGPKAAAASATVLGHGVGVDELGGESSDPEVLARDVGVAAGVADHDLDAAAAEVEAQRRRGLEEHAR